jgi:hypothetical protein
VAFPVEYLYRIAHSQAQYARGVVGGIGGKIKTIA